MRFVDARVGQVIPPLEQVITLPMMVAYAGATWDWHRYHYDEAFCRQLGYPAPFVDGQMFGALLARQLLDWAGPDAALRALTLQYRTLVHPGERVVCQGGVVAVTRRGRAGLVRCALQVVTTAGAAVVDPAEAEVAWRLR